MRRVLPILIALFFLLPVSSAFGDVISSPKPFNFKNGLLDDKKIIAFNDLPLELYDNLSTSHRKKGTYRIEFKHKVNLESYYFDVFQTANQHQVVITFVDSKGFLRVEILNRLMTSGYKSIAIDNVIAIDLELGEGGIISEFDFFGSYDDAEDVEFNPNESVSNLSSASTYNSVGLSWGKPNQSEISNIIIRNDGVVVAELPATATTYKINGLMPNTEYTSEVIVKYENKGESLPVAITTKTDESPKVTGLKAQAGHNSAKLTWLNPNGSDFVGVDILKDGVKILGLEKPINNYTVTNLLVEKEYKYEVVARFAGGFQSESVLVIFKTLSEPLDAGDISSLLAKAKHDRVDINWKLPDSDNFKHVNIYRETLKKSLIDKILGINTAMAATAIFETDGTYFNDLTVKSETKYEYTLTTTSTEKVESDGVSVTVTTLKDPTPEIGGGGFDKDPDTGDFTYYWTEPTDGKVKVMVGGQLYATVPAVDGKIIIPSGKMKYTIFGSPDIQLIPVSEDGIEGKPVKPPSGGGSGGSGGDGNDGGNGDGGNGGGGIGGGVDKIPFQVSELIKTTFAFLALLSGIILLILAIELVPKLIRVIKKTVDENKAKGAAK